MSCANCGNPLRAGDAFCPKCGTAAERPAAAPPASKPMPMPLKIIGVGFLVLVAASLAFSDPSSSSSSGTPAVTAPTSKDAKWMCRQFMEDSLKAPATAKFSNSQQQSATALGNSTWSVSGGYVDSENSFGANIRTRFSCTVRHTGGDSWRLESLQTDP